MNKSILSILVIVMVTGLACATSLTVIEPTVQTVYNDGSVMVGSAGPGQTVYLVAERYSDDAGTEAVWDSIRGVTVPDGWEIEDSPYYENPMKLKIKIAPNAANGQYNLTLMAEDEGNYHGKGNMTFYAIVTVDQEVISINVRPTGVQTGVGQPATYYVTIENTGVASDVFQIRADGLPAWEYSKIVLVNYQSEKTIPYEVVANERLEDHAFTLEVTSMNSPMIHKETGVALDTRNNLISDWKATSHGAIIFPILEQPIYSILGLLGQLLG